MSIYLITNRRILKQQEKEIIDSTGKEKALHDFRIATVDPKTGEYQLLPDLAFETGYKGVLSETTKGKLGGSAAMFADLYRDMDVAKPGQGDVLFFIHGFNYTLEDNLKHVVRLHRLYAACRDCRISHVVYLSWPSRGSLLSYPDDQQDAWQTGLVLARLFDKVRRFFHDAFSLDQSVPCQRRIHLAAHSMGNQVLAHMIQNIPPSMVFPLFSEVVLLNADVVWTVFEAGEPFNRLHRFCERTHIYTHRSDDALRVSRLTKNFEQRLGSKGPRDPIHLAPETMIADTSDVRGGADLPWKERFVDHWGYLTREAVIQDIRHVLNGIDEDDIPGRKRWAMSQGYFWLTRSTAGK